MHGPSRLSNEVGTLSPPSSPRHRGGRGRSTSPAATGRLGVGAGSIRSSGGRRLQLKNVVERLGYLLVSSMYRRRAVLLFAPLLYASALLLYMGAVGFDAVNNGSGSSGGDAVGPGSVYRSPEVFEKLWPFMEAEGNRSSNLLTNVWSPKSRQGWRPCITQTVAKAGATELPRSNGYLIIEANGGLNQQRLSICDAVAVAGLLNATLVIPIFHLNSVWKDSSKFGDIFDEEFFIYALRNHVNVIRELPEDILQQFDNNISNIINLRVKAWSSHTHYLRKVLPRLMELKAVRIAPFSNRLAHAVPPYIQGLRCLCNFEALRFSDPIRLLAAKMVDRMVKNSSKSSGKYVSVHLRFEEDMVAFSCCIYDGGDEEKHEMDIVRERSWRGKFRKKGRLIRPGANRVNGKCPLTPLEVGMMLRGMGFDNNTSLYVAAGKIYKVEKHIAPLKQMFPRLETKETLASHEELAPFTGHSSRLAALDYTFCLHSEVFVTTQGGNFPHFLVGHRRYLNGGHAKTIKPDKRKLAQILDKPNMRWQDFKRQMQEMLHHSDLKGLEVRKASSSTSSSSSSLYMHPMPDCMCRRKSESEYTTTGSNSNRTILLSLL
ncbi:O-fucosyltransferase 9-like isoform X1 [Andrographis paniculata]|uniref:O-fucosyltransferase 9-like isoform X1 n=1 Tax=Andrographis paniculata TaxID=175694 RepID=UPI0021E80861|nr:O-fucosyltransferase 9-like isoform X1 [Andrographis paniculata]